MSTGIDRDCAAAETYDAFAPAYDAFNHLYEYESWTAALLAAARATGLEGDRLLDVGCGTGLSFLPMLERGWSVTACDISPGMLDVARKKTGDRAELLVADMRSLPALGRFDLVWAVNDAANYLLGEDELEQALRSMATNLDRRGRLLFDLNTELAFQTFFRGTHRREFDGRRFTWRGEPTSAPIAPGEIHEASFEAEGEAVDHVHRQRHFPEAQVLAAIAGAGLQPLAVLGERDGNLDSGLDETRHTKAVFICAW
ncbi:MAG: class I SAM-dependent DNA methyltransferase [Solirubrobacterales bacterium]